MIAEAVEGLARVYHGGMITVTLHTRSQRMAWSFSMGQHKKPANVTSLAGAMTSYTCACYERMYRQLNQGRVCFASMVAGLGQGHEEHFNIIREPVFGNDQPGVRIAVWQHGLDTGFLQ